MKQKDTTMNFHKWGRGTNKILSSCATEEFPGVRALKASFVLKVWLLKLRANLEPAQVPDPNHRVISWTNLSLVPWPCPATWDCVWLSSQDLVLTLPGTAHTLRSLAFEHCEHEIQFLKLKPKYE